MHVKMQARKKRKHVKMQADKKAKFSTPEIQPSNYTSVRCEVNIGGGEIWYGSPEVANDMLAI